MNQNLTIKSLFFLITILITGQAYSSRVPDMVCHQLKIVHINPQTFSVNKSETDNIKEMDLYKISGGELYVSSPSRKEYKYNKLVEIEKLRYYSGHKTLLFNQDFTSLITTHTYEDEIRVGKFRCLTMKK
jgi:hypothetical protein